MALSLSRDYGARLVVVHVAQREIVHAGLIGGPDEVKPHLEEVEAQLRDYFEEDLDTHAEVHVSEGEPASAILHVADEVHADLIAMGTTGRSGFDRLLLGSVAEAMMRKAHCPVLTVWGPAEIAAPQVPPLATTRIRAPLGRADPGPDGRRHPVPATRAAHRPGRPPDRRDRLRHLRQGSAATWPKS